MIWSAGIDVGGRQIKAVAVSADGAVLRRVTRETADGLATPAEWREWTRGALTEFARELQADAATAGVCAPGLVAADGRSIAHCPGKLEGITGIDWTAALGRTAPVPVLNDAHAAIVGEAWIGAARGKKHVVMFTLGTGVGGAVICDGRLLRGAIGRAGHLGHLSLDPEGPRSIAGMPGAIEVMIGDCSVAERSGGKFTTTTVLVAAHRAGDAAATRVWLKSIRALGCAIGSCINILDPEVVVIGGGIAQAGEALFVPLADEVARVEWRPGGHRVPLVPATLGEWAGAIGAARHAMNP